jgi:hypothetical protein
MGFSRAICIPIGESLLEIPQLFEKLRGCPLRTQPLNELMMVPSFAPSSPGG